ncbi:MAG: endonuclease domain-containing protein [Gammaproteobacteria bacterium]
MNHNARTLRSNPTDAEKLLWKHLRLRQLHGYKFRRQFPLGSYIVDFVCLEARLVIEVDGGQHIEQSMQDERRTEWLRQQGFTVLRFWNNQVLQETEAVKVVISEALCLLLAPHPSPPPSRGRVRTPSLPRWGRGLA